MCELLLDTDTVIKLSAYRLLYDIEHAGCPERCAGSAGILVAATFVARKQLERKAANATEALLHLQDYLGHASLLEPSQTELNLAAELEADAANAGLDLDVGESQLCAIALRRGTPVLLTGDKRAIVAAEELARAGLATTELGGRVACLEQAMCLAVDRLGALEVRSRVVDEKDMDKAVSISFQFTNPNVDDDFEPAGLVSYINDLRTQAPTMLLEGVLLSLTSVA